MTSKLTRVYFSFDYERDLERVKKVYRLPNVVAGAAAGFHSTQVWQTAARRGENAVHGLVRDALNNTSVTVVCLGHMSAYGKYLTYEIESSLDRGNGLVGIQINHLTDRNGIVDPEGYLPPVIKIAGYKVYKYTNPRDLATWIREAEELAAEIAEDQRRVILHRQEDE